jgi:hypothetical protein
MEVVQHSFCIFPVGTGCALEKNRYPALVLGNDWGNEKQRDDVLRTQRCHPNEQRFVHVIEAGGFNLDDCFFGNCLLALRKADSKTTGMCSMHKDEEHRQQCLAFWREFIKSYEVKVVITLGVPAARFAAELFPSHELNRRPRNIQIKDLPAEVLTIDGCVCAHLLHPVMRARNLWRRNQDLADYHHCEEEYLRAAHAAAGLA